MRSGRHVAIFAASSKHLRGVSSISLCGSSKSGDGEVLRSPGPAAGTEGHGLREGVGAYEVRTKQPRVAEDGLVLDMYIFRRPGPAMGRKGELTDPNRVVRTWRLKTVNIVRLFCYPLTLSCGENRFLFRFSQLLAGHMLLNYRS